MADINSISPGNDVLNQYALTQTSQNQSELGKSEFMELMVAQLNNQNPLEPQDNGEFIAQLAQFSSLEEMQKVSNSVGDLTTQFRSTQALQASAMVGRSVLVNASSGPNGIDGTMSGIVDVPASTSNLSVSILNSAGELVQKIDMGQQIAGQVAFSWDGRNSAGELMPVDQYTIKAEASYNGANEQLGTMLSSNVDSVSIGSDGAITLNLAQIGAVPLSEVRQIN